MLYLILPKTHVDFRKEHFYHLPLYFLAGPVAGGDDWHKTMTNHLLMRMGGFIVANPSRYRPSHPFYGRRMPGTKEFETQTLWERHYLRQAASGWLVGGCIIFWLACESKTHPRTDGNPYAMDTRGELGEWRAHLMHDPKTRIVIGAEPGFPGLRTIQRNFEAAVGKDFRIYNSMEGVADRAAQFAK